MKQVNEKTFELNITNELLNTSKSFLWYINSSPLHHFFPVFYWERFLNSNIFFAEGLTQAEESREGGGYDVSINFPSSDPSQPNRLMFLQYKSGIERSYCKHPKTVFINTPIDPEIGRHISFSFNDAAHNTQHSILRNLANQPDIQAESVMYVFPRITEKEDFVNSIGNLVDRSSFVSVKELDVQAIEAKKPIVDGKKHNYRTSYDGTRSEVNFYYFYYYYYSDTYLEFLAELICIQIERLARAVYKMDRFFNEEFKDVILNSVKLFLSDYNEKNQIKNLGIISDKVEAYLSLFNNEDDEIIIPPAPEKFTTILKPEGIKFSVKNKQQLNFEYQIF